MTGAAIAALVLIVAAFVLTQFNRSAQEEINQRQQFINQGIEVGHVDQMLTHALAVAAIRDDDPKLKAILARAGITVHATAPAGAAPAAASPAAPTKPKRDHQQRDERHE